jgi:hypothetical protein
MEIKDLEIVKTSQSLFDNFNGFILSEDTKVFGKLLARTLLMNEVKDVPGDIVECGVFKGTGILTFLKLKKFLNPNSGKKVLGFDFFDTESLIDSLSSQDKLAMSTLFQKRNFSHDDGYQKYLETLISEAGFQDHDYELISGDISKTMPDYINTRPGMKISLLYLDLDLAKPTYDVLDAAWDRVSRGGIVVFDEYAFHHWSESQGADHFFKDKEVEIKNLNYIAPSAYVRKL